MKIYNSESSLVEACYLFSAIASTNITGPNYWSFVRGIHRPLVDSPHKGLVMLRASPWHMTSLWKPPPEQYYNCPLKATMPLTDVPTTAHISSFTFNSLAPARGDLDSILKVLSSILICWLVSSDLLMIMPSDECHGIYLKISQHWFR